MAVLQAPVASYKTPLFDQVYENISSLYGTEDREAFEHCTARDVIAAVQHLNIQAEQSRTRRFLARFVAVVRPLETYFDVVNNVVGSIPGAQLGAIVFGALRFVVKVYCCHTLSLRNFFLMLHSTQPPYDRPSVDYRTTSSESWESWRRYLSYSLIIKIMQLRFYRDSAPVQQVGYTF